MKHGSRDPCGRSDCVDPFDRHPFSLSLKPTIAAAVISRPGNLKCCHARCAADVLTTQFVHLAVAEITTLLHLNG